jgi:N-methylhydantoinase B/oxoprolinase/acetone carboxylase alpha subunit
MDPITAELFRNAIAAIGDEMVLTIYRTAYSGVLKNIMDYSAALCDDRGRLVAQGLSLPGHLCSIPVALQAVLQRYGDNIAEGDILISNDPYEGGMNTHPPSPTPQPSATTRIWADACPVPTPPTAPKSMRKGSASRR